MTEPQQRGKIPPYSPIAQDDQPLGTEARIWKTYVEEASEWDKEIIDSWNKSLDIYLVFAALFSAVVTAFLIESYENLKPDHDEIITTTLWIIAEALRNSSSGHDPGITSGVRPSLPISAPTTLTIAVNVLWSISLSLSVATSLVAMLVKQWSERYLTEQRPSTPYAWSRVRQSRYNRMQSWGVGNVVSALPIVIHLALGLFMSGLVVFLYEVNFVVFVPVMAIVALTLFGYLGTLVAPLLFEFCPWDTPLSSRTLWCAAVSTSRWIVCQIFAHEYDLSDGKWPMLPCQQKEKKVAEKCDPDTLAAQAIQWLIVYSQKPSSVELALESIAGSATHTDVPKYLAQESVITLVIQKFTSLLISKTGTDQSPDKDKELASIYGRALANLLQQVDYSQSVAEARPDTLTTAPVTATMCRTQAASVECGLTRLLFDGTSQATTEASTMITLSTWYTSINRRGQTKEIWQNMLKKSIDLLTPPCAPLGYGVLAGLGQTLAVEVSRWRWDSDPQERKALLQSLVKLFDSEILNGPARGGVSLALAMIALIYDSHPDIPLEEVRRRTEMRRTEANGFKIDLALLWQGHRERHGHLAESQQDLEWIWRAECIAKAYTANPRFLEEDCDSLLLLGLSGLLRSFTKMELTSAETLKHIASLVARQLRHLPLMRQPGTATLPSIFPDTFDLKQHVVTSIASVLGPSRTLGLTVTEHFSTEDKIALLKCLSEKKHIWLNFGCYMVEPILYLLSSTDHPDLQAQCMIALYEYRQSTSACQSTSSSYLNAYHDNTSWYHFFNSGTPHKLVCIYRDSRDETLRSRAITTFDSTMRSIPRDESTKEATKKKIRKALVNLALDGDHTLSNFHILVGHFIKASTCEQSIWWKDEIVRSDTWLPETSALGHSGGEYSGTSAVNVLREACIAFALDKGRDVDIFVNRLAVA